MCFPQLPLSPYSGARGGGGECGGADPYERDALPGRIRSGCALALQGGRCRVPGLSPEYVRLPTMGAHFPSRGGGYQVQSHAGDRQHAAALPLPRTLEQLLLLGGTWGRVGGADGQRLRSSVYCALRKRGGEWMGSLNIVIDKRDEQSLH